jgi:murein DD-endopeptidase MepM/ murein hydrolase activator NlpD
LKIPLRFVWHLSCLKSEQEEVMSPTQHHRTGLKNLKLNQQDFQIGVTAAEAGIVAYVGWTRSYGNVIYLNHRGGYQTRYTHLEEIHVRLGQIVGQGALLGESRP